MSYLIQPTPVRYHNMPSAQSSPFAMPQPQSSRGSLRVNSSQDLCGINASLSSNHMNRPSTPVHHIFEDDYTVPAPPPPSPVSFRPDGWPKSRR